MVTKIQHSTTKAKNCFATSFVIGVRYLKKTKTILIFAEIKEIMQCLQLEKDVFLRDMKNEPKDHFQHILTL